MPTFAHHYVDPSSVLKTALYEACLKGRLFADRLKLRFYFANSSTANEIVKVGSATVPTLWTLAEVGAGPWPMYGKLPLFSLRYNS